MKGPEKTGNQGVGRTCNNGASRLTEYQDAGQRRPHPGIKLQEQDIVSQETLDVRVRGKVQGVGFRAAAVRHAHLYGVNGWVSNAADGSVELVLQGDPDQLDRMVSWLHRGPDLAVVEQVDLQRSYSDKQYGSFQIR